MKICQAYFHRRHAQTLATLEVGLAVELEQALGQAAEPYQPPRHVSVFTISNNGRPRHGHVVVAKHHDRIAHSDRPPPMPAHPTDGAVATRMP